MAEGGTGLGRGGRGAMIAKLLQMEKKPGQWQDQPCPSTLQPVGGEKAPMAQTPLVSLGRGALLRRLEAAAPHPPSGSPPPLPQATSLPSASPHQPPATPAQPPAKIGRGALLQRLHQTVEGPQSTTVVQASQPPLSTGRGKMLQNIGKSSEFAPAPQGAESRAHPNIQEEEVRKKMGQLHITPNRPPVIFQGKEGQQVDVTSNYIPLYLQPNRGLFEYEVIFNPQVDDKILRENMIFGQHKDLFGRTRRTFDGVTLYLPHRAPDEALHLTSLHPVTNETHNIILNFRRQKEMTECPHMFNVLFKIIQRELNLVQLDRKSYSPELAYPIPQHKLEIWPGLVTAVDAFEGGIMLNCDISHKVLRTQTVLDLINDIVHVSGGQDWKAMLQKQVVGQIVMTKRPVKTYRIDDIEFNQTPSSTFTMSNGKTMSYIEYHREKGIDIKDAKQPLLIHRPKPTKRRPGAEFLSLIPELCFLTGLTDDMRADFKVMKDVAAFTRINPNQRQLALEKFINNIKGSPNCIKLLDEWGLKVPENTIEMTARTMDPEPIIFGRNYIERGFAQADWGRTSTNQHMLEVVHIENWLVLFSQRDERNANGFVEMMGKLCPQMGMRLQYPTFEKIRDDRTETYLKSLRSCTNQQTQIVVIIFPTSRDDRYAAVKKLLCVDKPIPSQVINSRTISRPDKLRSIVQKIALQMNCKLGGALWSLKIPMKRIMVCGIDTYHDSKVKSKSVAAFVTSTDPDITKWFSQVFIHSTHQEVLDGVQHAMIQALYKYNKCNNCLPSMVIIFRDGVGDGMLKVVEEHEIESIKNAFQAMQQEYNPSLVFIVCQKRINTRIFLRTSASIYDNPAPGTVLDHSVTRRYYQDFFLVSQMVRQGTVTPTHYIVIHNTDSRLTPDRLQKLTYKMCHLYYNWPGTVRVPAPCQYAHKLAHLVGCNIHKPPATVLCDKLFFL